MTTNATPVWFITGCSTGFGRELVQQVLAKGWRVVITARNLKSIDDLAKAGGDRALALALDVTDDKQIAAAVKAAESAFGQIDVLVNNAGYGYQATVEEGVESEIRAMFDANVFGLFAVTRAILPGMRKRRSGHIINISSVAGLAGFAGSGYYAASKHAVEGWSDSLLLEGKPLNIKVTCVEPGPFRTDWAGRSLKQTASQIAEYADTAASRMAGTAGGSGSQPGDPVRAALAMIAITEANDPPRHFVLGAIGWTNVSNRLKAALGDIDGWKTESLATDFPKDQ